MADERTARFQRVKLFCTSIPMRGERIDAIEVDGGKIARIHNFKYENDFKGIPMVTVTFPVDGIDYAPPLPADRDDVAADSSRSEV